MAFQQRNLSVLACANGFTLWHYQASLGDDPRAPGYFRPAHGLCRTNDVILAPPFGIFLVVSRTDDEVLAEQWPGLDALLGADPDIAGFDEDEFARQFNLGLPNDEEVGS